MKTAEYNIDPEKIKALSEDVGDFKEGISIGEACKLFLIFVVCISVFMSISVMTQSQWQWVTNNAYFMTHYFVYTDIAFSPFTFSIIMLILSVFLCCLYFRLKHEEKTGEYTFVIEWGYRLPSAEAHLNFLKTIVLIALVFLPAICSSVLIEAIYTKISTYGGFLVFLGMALILGLAAIGGTVFGSVYLIHWRNTATEVNQYKEAFLKTKRQLQSAQKKGDTSAALEAQIQQLNFELDASEKIQVDYYQLQQDLQAAYRLIEGRENLQEAAKKSGFSDKLTQSWLMGSYVMLKEAQQKGIVRIGRGGKKILLCKKSTTEKQRLTQTPDARRMRKTIRENGGQIEEAAKSHNRAAFCSLSDMAEAGYVLENTNHNLPPLYRKIEEGNFVEFDPKKAKTTQKEVCNILHTECVGEVTH